MSRFERRRRCVPSDESGSVVVGMAIVGLVLVLAVAVGATGAGVVAYTAASNAADAAALAAAPVTFRPFGAKGTPTEEAARFARRNGTRLTSCVCPVDASWTKRTVVVTVRRTLRLPGIGAVSVSATSRATFDPSRLLPADPELNDP